MGVRQASRPVRFVLALGLLAVIPLGIVTAGCSGSASGASDDNAAATPKQGGTYDYPLSEYPGSFRPTPCGDPGRR